MQKINPREITLKILYEIEVKSAFANETMDSYFGRVKLSSLDSRFIRQLVNGTTKLRRRLDYILSFFLKKEIEKLSPWVRNILRLGLYQIEYLDRVPDHSAVDESVKLAKRFGHKGTAGLVNAVLRSYLRNEEKVTFPSMEEDKVKAIGTAYSFPDWIIEDWLKILSEKETIKLCETFNQKAKVSFRLNTLRIDQKSLERALDMKKIKYRKGNFLDNFYWMESKIDLENLFLFQKGYVYPQDESAGFSVRMLAPRPGESILDMCAAPGGKLTYIAELLKNTGRLIALDSSPDRMARVKENCQRLGIEKVIYRTGDAQSYSSEQVDKVLIDAPCSGLGVLGRNSDARWQKNREDIKRLAKLQSSIISNAANLVKKGGVMIYTTCTLSREENENIIDSFLKRRDDFKQENALDFVDSRVINQYGFVRTYPHIHELDGTFAARLKKIC
ncbi:MAG: 16S rRNA (cytosine(967)-C(5))-methyltransferase RsmB [candidate division Zixibacteria bacterium]|nr:16S rRNA (cytosine(967)-C(5))-methyltransferase RsmB [candidate division Zixibacteria bacterium]